MSIVCRTLSTASFCLIGCLTGTVVAAQSGSTFTPDPYFPPATSHPDVHLTTPESGKAAGWVAPATTVPPTPKPVSTATNGVPQLSSGTNQVRSLLATDPWNPPATPVTPGYDPKTLQHSTIPWQQAAAPASEPAAATSSIIREQQKPADKIAVEGLVKNPFSASANNDFAPSAQVKTDKAKSPLIAISPPEQIKSPLKIEKSPKKPATKTPATQFVSSLPKKPLKAKAMAKPASVPTQTVKPIQKPTPKAVAVAPVKTFDLPTEKNWQDSLSSKPANAITFEATQVLAMVGGEPIFRGDALLEVNQLIEKHMAGAPEEAKARERKNLIKRILPKLVDQKILYVGALETLPDGVDIEKVVEQASSEFDEKALPDMLKQAKFETAADYDAHLRSLGSSLRKQRDAWARDQLTRYFLSEQINKNEEITHQELLKEYRANEASYRIPARSKWEQIMVRYDRFGSREEARKTIEALGNQLIYGANLSALAKKESHGFKASSGGQHAWTSKDALVLKEIDKAIFTLPVNELSDIIETRDGLHIVRVLERQEAGFKPFTEAQGEIKERIKQNRRGKAFEKHIAKLRKRIPVEYYSDTEANVAARPSGLLRE